MLWLARSEDFLEDLWGHNSQGILGGLPLCVTLTVSKALRDRHSVDLDGANEPLPRSRLISSKLICIFILESVLGLALELLVGNGGQQADRV